MINSIPTKIISTKPQLKLVPIATQMFHETLASRIHNSNSSIKKGYLTHIIKPFIEFFFNNIEIFKNNKLLLNSKNEEVGKIILSYKKDKTMNIGYISLDEKKRKIPNTFIASAFMFINEIINQGNKKSIKKITCLPLSETQDKLYKKFGFKDNGDGIGTLEIPFKNFKENAQTFFNKYSL